MTRLWAMVDDTRLIDLTIHDWFRVNPLADGRQALEGLTDDGWHLIGVLRPETTPATLLLMMSGSLCRPPASAIDLREFLAPLTQAQAEAIIAKEVGAFDGFDLGGEGG